MPSTISPRLTGVQKKFLVSVLSAIVDNGGPVSVPEIRDVHGQSESRIRSHIKTLQRGGYLCCVGKSKVKKFVPSISGLDAVFDLIYEDPRYDDLEKLCVGGRCQRSGCNNLADDFFKDGYYCRLCIIGHNDESDMADIRRSHELRWFAPSVLGQALDMINPTYGDDIDDL